LRGATGRTRREESKKKIHREGEEKLRNNVDALKLKRFERTEIKRGVAGETSTRKARQDRRKQRTRLRRRRRSSN
jgi:hypothetical protein